MGYCIFVPAQRNYFTVTGRLVLYHSDRLHTVALERTNPLFDSQPGPGSFCDSGGAYLSNLFAMLCPWGAMLFMPGLAFLLLLLANTDCSTSRITSYVCAMVLSYSLATGIVGYRERPDPAEADWSSEVRLWRGRSYSQAPDRTILLAGGYNLQ